MSVDRKYQGKAVDMLLSISTIVESAIDNKAALIEKRAGWADPFFDNLKKHIDQVISDYLGVDSAKALRKATGEVNAIQATSGVLLAEFKVQIEEDFRDNKPRRAEILKTLGFTDYLKATQNGDQEALISLLYQFKTNMDDETKTEIVTKGTSPATIDKIMELAQILKNKNIAQEGFKGTRKQHTAEAITAFNGVYEQTISIARIAAKFFRTDKTKAALFSYTSVRKALNSKPGNNTTPNA